MSRPKRLLIPAAAVVCLLAAASPAEAYFPRVVPPARAYYPSRPAYTAPRAVYPGVYAYPSINTAPYYGYYGWYGGYYPPVYATPYAYPWYSYSYYTPPRYFFWYRFR